MECSACPCHREALRDCNNQHWYFHLEILGTSNKLTNQSFNHQEGALQLGSESRPAHVDPVPGVHQTVSTQAESDHTRVHWSPGGSPADQDS